MNIEVMKQAQHLCMEVRQQCGPRLVALAIPLYEKLGKAIEQAEQAQPGLHQELQAEQSGQCSYPYCEYPCMKLPDCRDAGQAQPVAGDMGDAVNLARTMLEVRDCKGITPHGVRVLCEAIVRLDVVLIRQPLTDAQIFEIHKQVDSMQYLPFARAIEAAHGIKEQ